MDNITLECGLKFIFTHKSSNTGKKGVEGIDTTNKIPLTTWHNGGPDTVEGGTGEGSRSTVDVEISTVLPGFTTVDEDFKPKFMKKSLRQVT